MVLPESRDVMNKRNLSHLSLEELIPRAEIGSIIRAGGIDHALVVATLYRFELWRSSRD